MTEIDAITSIDITIEDTTVDRTTGIGFDFVLSMGLASFNLFSLTTYCILLCSYSSVVKNVYDLLTSNVKTTI
jgi:Na+/glutamate symporter